MSTRPRAAAREVLIVALLGAVLAVASLALDMLESSAPRVRSAHPLMSFAAGLAAAVIVRIVVRLYRRWAGVVGRLTAAAVLCALAALAGALLVMIPSECPGGLLATGRCGMHDAAAWGQVSGLAAVVNFAVAGLLVAMLRTARDVLGEGTTQGVVLIRVLGRRLRRRTSDRPPDRPRGPQEPKGRPTPRRADAERARRERSRARA